MQNHNAWVLKTRYGSFLLWTIGYTKKDVLNKLYEHSNWKVLKKDGCKIVKVKFIEIIGASDRTEK